MRRRDSYESYSLEETGTPNFRNNTSSLSGILEEGPKFSKSEAKMSKSLKSKNTNNSSKSCVVM